MVLVTLEWSNMAAQMHHAQCRRMALLCACAGAGAVLGCSVQKSELLTALDPDVVVTAPDASVIAAIDERPMGGASLTTGTTGGGNYAAAFAAGRLFLVDTIEGLKHRVSGDEPAIVLVAAGTYAFTGAEQQLQTCSQACDPTTPLAEQTVLANYCKNGETLSDTAFNYDTLKVGSNKTVIGLAAGAKFTNVEVSLSNSSNIILRNLSITDVAPNIVNVGYGLRVWPSNHVWLDHLTLRNIGHGYIHFVPDYDSDTLVIAEETGYITLTNSYFDGMTKGVCGQKSPFVVSSHRSRAVTLALNWFDGSRNYNPYLFGPEAWGHVFNNLWTNISGAGLAVACGATGVAQGNVFQSATSALYNNADGVSTWSFCSADLYGKLYAPMDTGDDEDNLLDATSTLNLHEQPTDGTAMTAPVRKSGNQFSVTVPLSTTETASYLYTLQAAPSDVPLFVKANAGVGKLF